MFDGIKERVKRIFTGDTTNAESEDRIQTHGTETEADNMKDKSRSFLGKLKSFFQQNTPKVSDSLPQKAYIDEGEEIPVRIVRDVYQDVHESSITKLAEEPDIVEGPNKPVNQIAKSIIS